MPKSLRERRAFHAAAAALLLVGGACGTVTRLGGTMRNHPPQLVGTWVDLAKSSPTDTALWILGSAGEDETQHLVRGTSDTNAVALFAPSAPKHYGYWFAQGEITDSGSRAICFTNRPGRSAPTCLSYALDTVREGGTTHRRLLVHGYRGEHRTSDRVLVAREP
jgi:hypothetical protein